MPRYTFPSAAELASYGRARGRFVPTPGNAAPPVARVAVHPVSAGYAVYVDGRPVYVADRRAAAVARAQDERAALAA
jgi:hypothetical protein